MVADIMKSLTIYEIDINKDKKLVPKVVCRDPRG